MTPVYLGEGELNWFRGERMVDRYGTFHLSDGGDCYEDYPGAPFGARGTLAAQVVEVRPPRHIGDLADGVGPSRPAGGEIITLGTGTLFIERPDGIPCIGVRPDDGRETRWMDPAALYRCHNQIVRVSFTPEEE